MSASGPQRASVDQAEHGAALHAIVSNSSQTHNSATDQPDFPGKDASRHVSSQDVDRLCSPNANSLQAVDKQEATQGQQGPSSASKPDQAESSSLLIRLFPVFLIALQFGMDSTLWLPTAYEHIAKCTSNGTEASHYLSLAQLLPAAVQLFVSLLVGPLAAMVGSLKWPACFLLLCSAVGNFIYSLAAPRGINSVWAIVGARCLLGLASGSASLAMAYLTVSTASHQRIEAMSLFRTFGGIAMVLGPLLSIPLTRVHFDVGHSAFKVDGTNAPTFLAAFTSLIIASLVAILLKDKSKPAHNAFVPLIGFFSSKDGRWKTPCLILGLMLVSAYLSANVLFLLSELLAHRWHIGITLASGIQAIVFALSLLASIGCGRMRQFIVDYTQKRSAASGSDAAEKGKLGDQAGVKLHAETVLTQASQVISVIAVLLTIVSVSFKAGSAATAVVFAIACTLAMMGYNIQAASLPSLFSQSLPADVRASLVPWYAATVAAGKLAAPPVTETIGLSNGHGWAASQSVPLALGLGAIAVLALASKRLVGVCCTQSAK